jgi:hypothetical protein
MLCDIATLKPTESQTFEIEIHDKNAETFESSLKKNK